MHLLIKMICSYFHFTYYYFHCVICNSEASEYIANTPSQWKMTLHCNVVSDWLGACTKWSMASTMYYVSFTIRYRIRGSRLLWDTYAFRRLRLRIDLVNWSEECRCKDIFLWKNCHLFRIGRPIPWDKQVAAHRTGCRASHQITLNCTVWSVRPPRYHWLQLCNCRCVLL